jgi:hypothetical protein
MARSQFPPCPECSGPVAGINPIIVEGKTHRFGGGAVIRDMDTVSGFTLIPCGHEVGEGVTWSDTAGYKWPA